MYAMEIIPVKTENKFNIHDFQQKNVKNNQDLKAIKKKDQHLREELYKEGLCGRIGLFLYTTTPFMIMAVTALTYEYLPLVAYDQDGGMDW
jgi:hypothetical protein